MGSQRMHRGGQIFALGPRRAPTQLFTAKLQGVIRFATEKDEARAVRRTSDRNL